MKFFLSISLTLLLVLNLAAQNSGRGFHYQGLARSLSGELLAGQQIDLRFSFILDPEDPSPVLYYSEIQAINTDAYGSFSATIGKGVKDQSSVQDFAEISFFQNFWLKIEIRENGKFNTLSVEKLLSVPYVENTVPVGTIIPFAGERIPDGWLLCNGTLHEVEDYPELYKTIGRIWTEENMQEINFRLPNIREGWYIVGSDHDTTYENYRQAKNAGITSYEAGSVQTASVKSHSHYLFYGQERPANVEYYENSLSQKPLNTVASSWQPSGTSVPNDVHGYRLSRSSPGSPEANSGLIDLANIDPAYPYDVFIKSATVKFIIKAW